MLDQSNRLKKDRDFNLLMKKGRWISGQLFDLKVLDLKNNVGLCPKKIKPEYFAKQLLVAFSVGLKISKSAVVRNRLRRQVSEVFRILIKDQKISDGWYVLVITKKEALKSDYREIEEDINNLVKRARLK